MSHSGTEQASSAPSERPMDFDGLHLASDAERPFVPKVGNWAGQWVWLSDAKFPDRQKCRPTLFCKNEFPHTVALFRREFEVPFAPCRTLAWLSGDTKYRCWVNGVQVASGPAEVGGDYGNVEPPDWWFYEGVDLAGALRQGRNVIAVEVVLGPQVQADYSMGRGGLLVDMLIEGGDGARLVVGTDGAWRAAPCEAETRAGFYDARRAPDGWLSPGWDDSGWPPADLLGPAEASAWNLLPREIPLLAETRIAPIERLALDRDTESRFDAPAARGHPFPARLKPGAPLAFWLRFPRELTGQIAFDVEGAEGTRLEIDFQETLAVSGTRECYVLPGRRWAYRSRRLQGFEYAQVTVTFPGGTACRTPLTIRALDAVFTAFPVSYRGHFECSDPFLNRLWDAGRWTTRLCMQAYHLDSPIHQEGLGCTGDYMIEAAISYVCFGEARLARKDILRTAYLLRQKHGRMFHTSYSLLWVWMVRDYLLYAGDQETVRAVMPAMHDLLDRFASYVGPTGLITRAPDYMFMDWVAVKAFNLHHPPGSMGQGYMSAFYFRALRHGAELSRLCGEASRAEVYDRRAAALQRAFHERLWDPARGLYRDGLPGATETAPGKWLPADPEEASFTVQTNAAAVAADIVPPDLRQAIVRGIMDDDSLPMVQPYFFHFVFEALARANLFGEYAFTAMNRWQALLDEHPSSLKEMWDGGDYSHAWGGTPTYQLSTRVLGVSCREPGFRGFSLRPCLGPLRMAKGIVPTPHGPVEVSWQAEAGCLKGVLRGPSGCEIALASEGADGSTAEIRQNGRRIEGVKTTEDGLCWRLNGGEYVVTIGNEPGAGSANARHAHATPVAEGNAGRLACERRGT